MARLVKCGLIQTHIEQDGAGDPAQIKQAVIDKHVGYINEAGKKGVQILCLQEIFSGPYFCAEQETRWYDTTERIPDGPTVKLMQELAKKHGMAIVVPIYE